MLRESKSLTSSLVKTIFKKYYHPESSADNVAGIWHFDRTYTNTAVTIVKRLIDANWPQLRQVSVQLKVVDVHKSIGDEIEHYIFKNKLAITYTQLNAEVSLMP